jgi:hypothetical protein
MSTEGPKEEQPLSKIRFIQPFRSEGQPTPARGDESCHGSFLSFERDPEQAADSLLSGLAGGPLPWLPGIPDRIAANPNWGPYLEARSHLVAQLADQIHLNAKGVPAWAHAPLPSELEGSGQAHPCISLNVVTV